MVSSCYHNGHHLRDWHVHDKIRYLSIYRVYGIDHAKMPSSLSKGDGSTFIYAQSSKLKGLWSV